jgi:WD40 repeat protein
MIVYSAHGDLIVSRSIDMTAKVCDTKTGALVHNITIDGYLALSHACSPQGNCLASSWNGNIIRVWSMETGVWIHTLAGHTGLAYGVVYSPDGSRIATCSYNSTIQLWDAGTGQCCQTMQGDNERLMYVLYSPKGDQLVTMSGDGASVWDLSTANRRHDMPHRHGTLHSIVSTLNSVQFATTKRPCGSLQLWDTQSGECLHTLPEATKAAFSPSGAIIACSSHSKGVRLWNVASAERLAVIDGFPSEVSDIAWSHGPTGDNLVAVGMWVHGQVESHDDGRGTMPHSSVLESNEWVSFTQGGRTFRTYKD